VNRYLVNKNSTILIKSTTRDSLKEIGRKSQTYDQLITELIRLKRDSQSLGNQAVESLQSRGSKNS
jgi:hypothetical protein